MTLSEQEIIKLQEKYKNYCASRNFAADLFDFNAELDKSLTFNESWQNIHNKVKLLLGKSLKEQADNAAAAQEMQQAQQRKQIEEQEKNTLEELQKIPALPIAEFKTFSEWRSYIIALKNSPDIHFLLGLGEKGLGKSFTTINTIKNLDFEYVYRNSKITPLMLYKFLFDNREGKLIIFDDNLNMLHNEVSLGMLLAALWSSEGRRVIRYESTSKLFTDLAIPNKFFFDSKVILLTNDINLKNKELSALQDRGFNYEFNFSYGEKVAVMREIIKIPNFLEYEKKKEILTYIEQKSNPAIDNFSFRLLLKAYSLYEYCSGTWKNLLDNLLKIDEAMNFVYCSIKNKDDVKTSINNFMLQGLGSRPTFFRLKKKLLSSIKVSSKTDVVI